MQDNKSDNQKYRSQLILSLKFHQSDTLRNLSLTDAIDALTQVWESCQNSAPAKPDEVIYL